MRSTGSTHFVLIIDDDDAVRRSFEKILRGQNVEILSSGSVGEGVELFSSYRNSIDCVLLDHDLPDAFGVSALPKIVAINPDVPIVIVTGHGSGELAAEAMKLGAVDFLDKPVSAARLRDVCQAAFARREIARGGSGAVENIQSATSRSAAMKKVQGLIQKVADTDINVLIKGDTGVGKEVVARQLHEHSSRKKNPFVAVNCAAIPKDLLESELFGHEKGAFTGADKKRMGLLVEAGAGTVFLDELGEMPMVLQAKILRAIQEKSVRPVGADKDVAIDARIVAASNVDLLAAAADGRFREDLYYRLAQFIIEVPALRDRNDDIPALVDIFMVRARGAGFGIERVSDGALRILQSYDWPGNIRQLENVIQRAAVIADGDTIMPEHLPEQILEAVDLEQFSGSTGSLTLDWPHALFPDADAIVPFADIELKILQRAVEACDGNYSEAARRLDVGRATLYRKLGVQGRE